MRTGFLFVVSMLLAMFCFWPESPAAADKALARVYIANLASPPQNIAAYCTAGEPVLVRAGEVASCRTGLPALFRLGFAGSSSALLDVSREGNFAVEIQTCSGKVRVQGALESLPKLVPGQTDYFVYVWTIGDAR